METLGMGLLALATGFLVLVTILPISKFPHGAIRGLEFPRQQYLLLAVVLATLVFFALPGWMGGFGGPLIVALGLVQLGYIIKFTPVWPAQSRVGSAGLVGEAGDVVSILAANVKLSNRAYDRLIGVVRTRTPDILIVVEVDNHWIDALRQALGKSYPHCISVPLDNGYGMAVLSRLQLSQVEVRDLITRDVPSIRTTVTLQNAEEFRLYVVHPEPPVVNHDTRGRDSEIALIGLEAERDNLPAVVAGDLNDVAWSTTTRRFQRLSGLLDPRVGRGFYNTFSATVPLLRWPLDHLFHDQQFRLVDMARLGKIGSDHFPMWFVLQLAGRESQGPALTDPSQGEVQRAKRMIVKERKRTRSPIGEDWEDG